jgi:hypothetical protein
MRRRRCLACGRLYHPDPRNAYHQRYCSNKACQKASHQASQARWLHGKKGRDYHSGPDACKRVRIWRAANPGYWRRQAPALQDDFQLQNVAVEHDNSDLIASQAAPSLGDISAQCVAAEQDVSKPARPQIAALQDDSLAQHPLFVGLVSMLTDALQDGIAPVLAKLQTRGQAILGSGSPIASLKGVCTYDGS